MIRKIEGEKTEELINRLSVGNPTKDFLRRTLRVDKTTRMDLEELTDFSFGTSGNILAEKKLNVELRSVNLSHNASMFTPKADKVTINPLFVDRSAGENRRASR